MTEAIMVAIITGGLTLIGTVITVIVSSRKQSKDMEAALQMKLAVMNNTVEHLTSEVREHNGFARRMPVVEEQIKVINHRIDDLEQEAKHGQHAD